MEGVLFLIYIVVAPIGMAINLGQLRKRFKQDPGNFTYGSQGVFKANQFTDLYETHQFYQLVWFWAICPITIPVWITYLVIGKVVSSLLWLGEQI